MTAAYASETDGDFDTWAAMEAVTQETRAALIADIVGHPKGLPSLPELDYVNPSVERSAIYEHLQTLRAAGVVQKREIPVGDRTRDLPHVFYGITTEARDFFDRNDLFDRDAWRDTYAAVEKPPEVERIQRMDRPDSA